MVEQQEFVLKYVGGGTFIIGIPAHDLTAAEVKEHGGIVELCKTGLYERVVAPEVKPKKAKARQKSAKVTKELESPPPTTWIGTTWDNIQRPKDGE